MKSPSKRAPAGPAARMRLIRQLHLYLGMVFAPSILFFAATGAIQLFGLHEADKDTGYSPPAVIEKLSQVHIHQRYAAKPKRPGPPKAGPALKDLSGPAKAPEAEAIAPIKWVFLATALGLVLSTLLGLWMGLMQSRNRWLALALLAVGAIVPILLLAL
ncbi:hypothetical protein [Phenylobacterium sp.]|uniref:hypothetical protein n=1 Tax=Phenylobacterium sp. TaxID=1871053 RepID=UPI0025F705F1|nr:hypothetical protein [Phenylobacterium sp.]